MELIKRISKTGWKTYLLVSESQGEKLYQSSPTKRDYVAILFGKDKNGRHYPFNRFGRVDLIGKGDSHHYVTEDGTPRSPELTLVYLS